MPDRANEVSEQAQQAFESDRSKFFSSALEFRFCPSCGAEVERIEFRVGKHRANSAPVCPNHGELGLR